jgi:hypothetical protein
MTIAMQQRGVLTPWIWVIRTGSTVTSRPDDLVGAAARVIAPIASGEPAQTRVQAAFDPTRKQTPMHKSPYELVESLDDPKN